MHLLLGGGKVLLEASALSSAKLELENFFQIFSIRTIVSTKNGEEKDFLWSSPGKGEKKIRTGLISASSAKET